MAISSEALNSLKLTDPTQLLTPSPALSQTARAALQNLFSSLRPFTPKSPFDQLLTDGFDAEQIWQQIDLQSQPLISSLRRDLKRFEKNPDEIKTLKVVLQGQEKVLEAQNEGLEKEIDGSDEELDEFDEDEEGEEEEDEEEDEEEGEENESEDEEEGEDSEGEGEGNNGIEDAFFKIKDLKKSLEDSEAREYGLMKTDKKKKKKKKGSDDDEDEEDEEEDEDGEEDVEIGDLDIGDDEDEEDTDKFARYEDFYGGKKEKPSKRKPKLVDGSKDLGINDEDENENEDEDEDEVEEEEEEDDDDEDEQKDEEKQITLSTHETKLQKLRSEIDKMEKANLEPKNWTMRGEVTAERRPKNSALEVDLDFEHNVRPPPVITEEVTASIEDIIQKRIEQGRFDDVQKAPTLPSKAPREIKELDENKSKKGLAEVYEEEYVQKTNAASGPLSFTDKQKQEASKLFKKLCLKLDALSHFHFTPKPVIEDMTVQANIPALAMEEIAPVAVSDAAMLAPEEVFSGKGDIKEEAELTQAERKRRRANKKRKYKGEA